MTSKIVVRSSHKSDGIRGISKNKVKDGEQSINISELDMEEDNSNEEDSRISSDMDDDEIDEESGSEEEENGSNAETDESDIEGENEEDNLSDEDEDMSEEEASDSDDKHIQGQSNVVAESEEGIDLTDSDDDSKGGGDDDDNGSNEEDGGSNDVKVAANPAWAQALAKILRTQKPTGKKAVVLSKARTIPAAEAAAAARKGDEPDFEIIGENDVKPKMEVDVKPTEEELMVLAKRKRLANSRVKQEKFDYNRERALTKIATRGVVQLFNAVRAEQKNLGSKFAEVHSTHMEEKLLKSIDKNSFLEHLTGKIRSQRVEDLAKEVKEEEDQPVILPKSWDELSKSVGCGNDSHGWDKVIEIKEEPED